ncbi:hypothetical protein P4E94_15150 [Pontiellaceae bacterium B12219]|nr:hypothetical protein [Pontiellaceae bacterium B12219]
MKHRVRCGVLCLAGLLTAVSSYAESELSFNASGEMDRLVLGGADFSDTGSTGFILRHPKGETRLDKISETGNKIRVYDSEKTFGVVFQIDTYPRHAVIHLLDVKGVGDGLDYSLSLQIDSEDIAVYTLNDLMNARGSVRKNKNTVLTWPYLWARPRSDGSRGSVVLFDNRLSGDDRDAVLAEIWSAQAAAGHMVKPAVESWTEADVLAWVDRWADKFKSIAVVSVDPDGSAENLYEMTEKYVIPCGANRVYMFSSSWRESGMTTPRTDVFPGGKADLIAYSRYLEDRGIQLQLKSLSPQIRDKKYLSSSFVDPRLMCWCSGTLAKSVDETASTIPFRLGPDPIVKMKEPEYIRLGHEVIKVGSVKREDEVWMLEDCERGSKGTTAKAHRAGTELSALVESNRSFNFEEDFGLPDSLGEEICNDYGDFLNEVNVSHLHFDGTGRMHEPPWYVREFTDQVYSRVDHPTTGSVVGGGGLPAHFEMKFSKAKEIEGILNYWILRIGPRLYQKGRKHTESATSELEIHFDIANGILRGSRRLFFCGGQSGGQLSLELLKTYGLTDHCLELFGYWNELAPVFDEADADYLRTFMTGRGNHHTGPVSAVLSRDGSGNYIFTPHYIMGRTSGEDELIILDQEWGAQARWQAIRAGTTMELENPYEAQEPQVMLYVKDDSAALKNPLITVNGKGRLMVKGEILPTEYMKFEGGKTATVFDRNWNVLRSLPATTQAFVVNPGKNTFTTASGNGSDEADLKVQYITLGPVYVLASNRHLSGKTKGE